MMSEDAACAQVIVLIYVGAGNYERSLVNCKNINGICGIVTNVVSYTVKCLVVYLK